MFGLYGRLGYVLPHRTALARPRVQALDVALDAISESSSPNVQVGRNLAIDGALVRLIERICQTAPQTAPVSRLAATGKKSSRRYPRSREMQAED